MITQKYNKDQIYTAAMKWYEFLINADYTHKHTGELQGIAFRHAEIASIMMGQEGKKPAFMIGTITSQQLEEQAVVQEYMIRLIGKMLDSEFLPK